ncbi:MAG: penicillin-binding protein 2 [Candidatus Sungbacteria bacterium]|nr:penicillin-binding protein 2 [Candidatus Sungbacteria bacterium]
MAHKLKDIDPDEIFVDSVSVLRSDAVGEGRLEHPITHLGQLFFILTAGAVLGWILLRAWQIGIVQGDEFLKKSRENRFFARSVLSPRGVIFDRFDRPLAENQPSFGIFFNRDEFLRSGASLDDILERLANILELPKDFFYESGFPRGGQNFVFPPRIFFGSEFSSERILSRAVLLEDIPGVEIAEGYKRAYGDSPAYSHVLGFVGSVSPSDLAARPELKGAAMVGRGGIEAFYDRELRGKDGKKIIEVDSAGRETRFRLTENAVAGSGISLTLDGALQSFIYDTLMRYTLRQNGAAVAALNPKNGEIYALVSFPGFDSNRIGNSISQKEFNEIAADPLKPFFNRAISGEFPSGSVIKPIIGAAALSEKIIDPQKKIYDEGFIAIPNPYKPGERSIFVDWRPHGWINFYDAIAQSANVYFYMIGGGFESQPGLGIERIKKYAEMFGFGSRLGIDLPGEKNGLIPDPEWKKFNEPVNPIWRVGDTYNVSIGQGGVRVTPLQLTSAISAIANGGTLWRPFLLKKIFNQDGSVLEEKSPEIIRDEIVPEDVLREVRRAMRQTVTSGTGRILQEVPVAVSAKTGTAQSGEGKVPHAWFTAYAPADDPEIAITVMVEHAGEGSTVAAPITRDILRWYFENRKQGN